MNKKVFLVMILCCVLTSVFTQSYKINNVVYDIEGSTKLKFLEFTKTKEYSLRQALDIDTDEVFDTFDELMAYISNIEQTLKNQRMIENSSVEYHIGETTENNIILIDLNIYSKDTWNMFPLPYPKFDSNDGFIFKLKVKDYNFFGTMRTFNFDLNYAFAQFPNEFDENGNPKPNEHQIGMNFDFEIPFKVGPFDVVNTNSAGFSFTIGKTMPNFDLSSKIEFSLPFSIFDLKFGFQQGVTYNDDYIETDDEFYFTEKFFISMPFDVYKIKNFAPIIAKPYVDLVYNWDTDISHTKFTESVIHEDLFGPDLQAGIVFSLSRINWINNFRKGISVSMKPYYKYNFYNNKSSPGLETNLKCYYTLWDYVGFNLQIDSYLNKNFKIDVGNRLRGVIDNFIEANNCISLNIDFPIRIIRTDWVGWGWTKYKIFSLLRLLNFEMQLSPFFDALLYDNPITGTQYNFKDGWYTCGLEMIVFPAKMRSLQVRISYGFDLTTVLPDTIINTDWRAKRSKDEIFFGVGLFY